MSTTTEDIHVHTLGPAGTNCEAAARFWLTSKGFSDQNVVLHETLEAAVDARTGLDRHVVLGCVVYPELHHIVFRHLEELRLIECFLMPTHPMVVAGDMRAERPTVASHPAPVNLLDEWEARIQLVNSNAEAALVCASGGTNACVTTSVAAVAAGLPVVKDFGPVPMGFTIHAPHGLEVATSSRITEKAGAA